MGGDGADGRENVLNTMVKLGNQQLLLLFCPFALSNINADANDTLCAPIVAV